MKYDYFGKQIHLGDLIILRKYVGKNNADALCIGEIVKFCPNTVVVDIKHSIDGSDYVIGKIAKVNSEFTVKLNQEQAYQLRT